jgi:hypothetical protein
MKILKAIWTITLICASAIISTELLYILIKEAQWAINTDFGGYGIQVCSGIIFLIIFAIIFTWKRKNNETN